MIYGYTPLFILMAGSFRKRGRHASRRFQPVLSSCCSPRCLIIPMVARIDDLYILAVLRSALRLTGTNYMLILARAALLIAACTVHPCPLPRGRLVAGGLVFCLCINFHIMPLVARLLQEPVKEAALLSKGKGYKVVMWKVCYPLFCYIPSLLLKKGAERRNRTDDRQIP